MVKPQDQIFNTALKEGTKIAGELLKNYFLGQYQTARDATYDTLTSKIEKPNEADHFTDASIRQPGVFQTDLFGRKDAEADYSQGRWKRYGQYKDKLGYYSSKDNLDLKRRKAYYSRHGPATNKNTPKYWAHKILW